MSYPKKAGYQDTDTSKAAASDLNRGDRLLSIRENVLAQFSRGQEWTADEVAERLGLSVLAVRPRCTELKVLGQLVDTGKRRCNRSGKGAAVMRATQQ